MSISPHSGIIDFGTFTSPSTTVNGIQGEVPQPLAGQQDYVLTANGFVPGGSLPGLGTMATQNANAVAITGGTITGTRINPRVSSTTSTATLTVDSDSYDQAVLTAQAVALSVVAPTGTPVNGQKLTLRFKDNATAQTISWTITSGGFRVIGCTLPTTTVISKVVYIGCIYNSNETFWDVVSVGQQI